jgi:hypothetical protein
VSDLHYGELKSAVNRDLRACIKALDEGDAAQARASAVSAVDLCVHSLNGGGSQLSARERSKALVRGILAAACRDLADCEELSRNAQLGGREVEKFWNQLVGCLERLEYVQIRLDGAEVEQLIQRVIALKDLFDQRFGTGMYANPEIVIRRELCSICNDDFRKCDHMAGRVYDGVMCRRLGESAVVRSVVFVKQSTDLRCRVWPGRWDEKTKQYAIVEMLNSFRVEDLSDPKQASV